MRAKKTIIYAMKKKVVFLSILSMFCVLFTSGCFTIDSATPQSSNEEHVVVRNYGWKLFYVIPIVCGNANKNAWFPWAFFRDDVTMNKIQSRFMHYAASKGKNAINLEYRNYDTVMFALPLMEFSIPIPYFLCYNEIQLSGSLK